MADQTPEQILAELQAYFAADATHDATVAAQVAALQAQVAALSAPVPFVKVTISEGTPSHCKLEFYNGVVVERDFPAEGDLMFTVDLNAGA